jgi:hypothetical protein
MQALANARTLRQLVLNPASMGLLALLTCGCGEENEPAPACADFEPMDPITLDVDARVITTSEQLVRNGTSIEPSLIADDSGVYWNDLPRRRVCAAPWPDRRHHVEGGRSAWRG